MTTPTYTKTPARLAVEKALCWGVAFTELDIQQFSGLETFGARRYLSALVAQGVLVYAAHSGLYSAGTDAETWRNTPPKTRPGGNNPIYRARQAVLDRWRQAAWAQGREVDEGTTGKTTPKARNPRTKRTIIAYTVAETAVFLGGTVRCVNYMIKRKDLTPTGSSGQRQISHAEITRYLEGRKP
jgi:hypothetical protein